jgi:tetratricopeptide (TPR) repeat protein
MRSSAIYFALATVLAFTQQPSAKELFNRALQNEQHGNYAGAIQGYEELLRLYPNELAVRANLAVALAHEGHYDEAIVQYRQVLAAAPHDYGLLTDLGLAYFKTGDYGDALREFKAAAQVKTPDARLAVLLGECDVKLGKPGDAAAALLPLEAANTSDPDFEYVLGTAMIHSGHQLDGVSRLEKAGRLSQNGEDFMEAGSTLMDLNRFNEAVTELETAFRLDPSLPGIYTRLGMAKDMTGDATGAEPLLRKALERDADDFNANLYLGSILYKQRDMGNAKTYLDLALKINPSSATAHYEVALWESTSAHFESAAKELEKLEKAYPNWLQPHVELAVVYYRLKRPADGMRERNIVAQLEAKQQQAGPPGFQPE